jgi:type IV fimbrial biogenesis protein FimT
MITIAITAIIVTIGVPSFRSSIASNRLTTTANAFISAYNDARLTSIRRNGPVQFCGGSAASNGSSDVLGTQCSTTAGAVYMLNADNTTATQVSGAPEVPAGITLGTANALRFNGYGFASAAVGGNGPFNGLLLDLSTNTISSNNRRCIYLTTGSIISVCTVSGTGACNASEPASCQQ